MDVLGKPSRDNTCGFVTTTAYEKLEAENTELRYKVHILEGGNKGLQILNDSLKANNDKLRELCRDMFTTISWCNLDCYPSDNKKREYVDRLRELGIEVPHECE